MILHVLTEEQIPAELDTAARALLGESFPHNAPLFANGRQWRGNIPAYSVVLEDGPTLCGHLAVADRTILAGDERIRVAGVANVCVRGDYRGRRLVDGMLSAAMEQARTMGFDMGLLFTHAPTHRVYARNGWTEIADQPFFRTEDGYREVLPNDSRKMIYPLHRSIFPAGTVDLLGDKW